MRHLFHWPIAAVLGVLLLAFSAARTARPTQAEATLVWNPYLQQLTDTSVIILWATESGDGPLIRYSTDERYGSRAEGETRTIEELDMRLHRVELTDLEPNTTYHYRISVDGEGLLPDEELSFQTAPPDGSDEPFTFLAFGDYGSDNDPQRRMRDQMERESFQFIVTTGDNAYPEGEYGEFDHHVFRVYDEIFPRVGLFPSLGNHDYLTDDAGPYLDLFELPENAARREDRERYYSFDYGNVHFAVLDSNRIARGDEIVEPMADWLREDLEATDLRWKIVVLHHPAYAATARHNEEESEILRDVFVPIFEEYGVNMVLAGHDHNYQRSKPLLGGEPTSVEDGGIVYVVTGAGSAADYLCHEAEEAEWLAIAYCGLRFGLYTRISVNGEQLSVATIDAGGNLRDCFTLGSEANVPSATPTPPPSARLLGRRFVAVADARIEQEDADENFGRSAFLRVDGGEDEEERSYIRFEVEGIQGMGRIEEATLWLFAGDNTPHETRVYVTDSDWSEDEITWTERPDRYPGNIERQESAAANSWVRYDVSNVIGGDGTYSFLLTGTSPDGVTFSSREGFIPPFLLLKFISTEGEQSRCAVP